MDLSTDEKIQNCIAAEFKGRTIIAIAHRMKTLLSYDRILVLDRGQVSELGSPAELFAKGGVFRVRMTSTFYSRTQDLCVESSLNERDIEAAGAARRLLQ